MKRLAAIVAADVPVHLRPAEADRQEALARLGSLRHGLIDPEIALERWRTLKPADAATPVATG